MGGWRASWGPGGAHGRHPRLGGDPSHPGWEHESCVPATGERRAPSVQEPHRAKYDEPRMILMVTAPGHLSRGSWCGQGAQEYTGAPGLGPGPVAHELCGCRPPRAPFLTRDVVVMPSAPAHRALRRSCLLNGPDSLKHYTYGSCYHYASFVGLKFFFLAHS